MLGDNDINPSTAPPILDYLRNCQKLEVKQKNGEKKYDLAAEKEKHYNEISQEIHRMSEELVELKTVMMNCKHTLVLKKKQQSK